MSPDNTQLNLPHIPPPKIVLIHYDEDDIQSYAEDEGYNRLSRHRLEQIADAMCLSDYVLDGIRESIIEAIHYVMDELTQEEKG